MSNRCRYEGLVDLGFGLLQDRGLISVCFCWYQIWYDNEFYWSYMIFMCKSLRIIVASFKMQTLSNDVVIIDPSKKSHNASDKYLTMHHFVTEMCTYVHISVTKWCIVGHGTSALWDLCNRLVVLMQQLTHWGQVTHTHQGSGSSLH